MISTSRYNGCAGGSSASNDWSCNIKQGFVAVRCFTVGNSKHVEKPGGWGICLWG
jgi:hypothetical protein